MKKNIQLFILGILLFSLESSLFAYRYTFSNHTPYPLFVGIKLCCAFEDLMGKVVKPNKMVTFVHGQDFPMEKFGYCLQSISFIKNPTFKNRIRPDKAPWKEVYTTWLKPEIYDDIVDFAEAIGRGSEEAGKVIAKFAVAAAAAPVTGGASVAVAGASEGTKQVSEKAPEQQAALKKERSFGLGRIAKGLAKLIAITTCRDRHWDIYEDENGKIVFISKIQQ